LVLTDVLTEVLVINIVWTFGHLRCGHTSGLEENNEINAHTYA
jgi:hypothetical protein